MAYTLKESQTNSDGAATLASAVYRLGQTFKAESSYSLTKEELLIYREGVPPNITVEIQDTTAGVPNNNVLATQSVDISAITEDTDGEWIAIVFDTPAVLTNGETYAIVVGDGWTDASNRFRWRQYITSDLYADGAKYYASTGENWVGTADDFTFKNYSGVGVAYADMVGTGGGTGGGSAALEITTMTDMVATGGGTGGGSAVLLVSGFPSGTAETTYKRVVVAGSDQIYYEDI